MCLYGTFASGSPPMPDMKATVLVNSTARGIKASFDPSRVVRYLEKRGISTVLALPISAEDATARARDSADRGDDLLFAVGGDGTVRDVAAGLAGSETALAAVPGGTVNVWAQIGRASCRERGQTSVAARTLKK